MVNRLAPMLRDRIDMTGLLRRMVHVGMNISTVGMNGACCEVDSIEDLVLYEKELMESTYGSHDWRAQRGSR